MARPLVVALALDRFHPFELGVACEVFGIDRRDVTRRWPRFVVAGPRAVDSSVGLRVTGLAPLSSLRRAELVIITGWERLEERPPRPVLRALADAHARGATMMSFCSGAFALAHAGLLDGRQATTHWQFAERLARAFPTVRVDARPLWTCDRRVWTAAGTAAAIDCVFAWVTEQYGQAVANEVARRMVASPMRSGGQAQFIEQPVSALPDRFAPAREAVLRDPGRRHTVRSLARACAMAPRSFARHFVGETGVSPYAWVIATRVAAARVLLETTDEPIEIVAARVAMDPANLRRRFRETHGLSPAQWRRAFLRAT